MDFVTVIPKKLFILCFSLLLSFPLLSQNDHNDSLNNMHLYKPPSYRVNYAIDTADTINKYTQEQLDSIYLRQKYIRDSIQARLKFIQDSIIAREKFIKDSIIRRQRILDSLHFLRVQLPKLFDATLKAMSEQMIIYNNRVNIIGDSTLCDYTFVTIPFNINQPFTPWKSTINLTDNPINLEIDTIRHRITAIESPLFNCTYEYSRTGGNIILINQKGTIIRRSTGNMYKSPLDSVFFDSRGRVYKVKRYHLFYQATGSYRKGPKLYDHLTQVKQFEYSDVNLLSRLEVVNFCDRVKIQDEHKVCYIVTYTFNKQNNIFKLTRVNDPENEYSDGTFIYEFDPGFNPKSVTFNNVKKTENWKCYVDLNEAGHVDSYKYKENGKINKSLWMRYYLNDPHAKNKVEIISCKFEDGISYYQYNNTTGKSRSRDRLTLEWSPWK